MHQSMPIIAAFVTPGLALAGAAAVAAPIIIHLLARRRFRRIRWAALEFLLQAERRNRRRLRMEEWILLALRCLAVALVGMFIARPFLAQGGSAWGGLRRAERVLLVDDSLSMAYESKGASSFSRAKAAVRRLIETAQRQTPEDTVTILRMTAPTEPLASGAALESRQVDDLLARVEAAAVTQRAVDPPDAIAGAAEVLTRNADALNAVVYVISDFQRTRWAAREGGSSAADRGNILSPLTQWAGDARGLQIVLVDVGDAEAANSAITRMQIAGATPVAGAEATVTVGLANYSDQGLDDALPRLSVGNVNVTAGTPMSLGARQIADLDIPLELIRPGDESVVAELPADGLAADNRRFLALEVAPSIRVMVVNGEPSPDVVLDEAALLSTALRPEGDVFSGNEIVSVDEAQLTANPLDGFHVVILANVFRLGEESAAALEQFVRGGGGLLIFLGDQVEPAAYNEQLYRGGEGVLPQRLGEVIIAPTEAHLVVKDRQHPALVAVGREDDPLGLTRVPFFRYFSLLGDEPVAESPDSSAPRPQATRVVAAFDDGDDRPALVEKRLGAGRVLLMTTSADKEWHSWPDHPTYLPVMMELVRYVARRPAGRGEGTVGAPLSWPVDPNEFDTDALVRTPDFPSVKEASISAATPEGGQGMAFRWDRTDQAGFYQIVLRRRTGGESIRMAAVNVDPSESDLTASGEAELRRALAGVPFEYIAGLDQLSTLTEEARVEVWRPVLMTLVCLLMLEQTLAWWWGRRR